MKNLGLMAKVSAAALVLAAGLMTGCGSSGGGSSKKTGTFEDAAVAGISYSASPSGLSGVTDADGKFNYKTGDTITFSIGGIVFPGGIPQDGIITPAHLAGTADWENDDTAVNIIQFLLSIDEDGDAENGIQIPADLAAYIDENEITIEDWADSGFDADLTDFIADVNLEFTWTLEFVDETTAKTHFNATIDALGIEIEIQIVSVAVACTAGNTSAIQGDYTVGLEGTITGDKTVSVAGTTLTYAGDEIDATCTFVQTQVDPIVVGDEIVSPAIITSTWVWTQSGNTYTINSSLGSETFIVLIGANTGTGALSLAE